jgi:acyl-phosphate glycerol 3-phosphate acyltransferase
VALPLLVSVLLAYLIGGVPFGYLVARWRGVDILKHGSGNIGATNVGRVLGRRLGILVFCLDFAKGALPVLAALRLGESVGQPPQVLGVGAGLAAFLGHLFPIYLRFRGGKGVATGAGVVAVLMPIPALAALVTWLAVVCASRYVSVASLTAALALCVIQLTATPAPLAGEDLIISVFCIVAALLVCVRHRANLSRLLRGEENRLGESSTMHQATKTIHVLAVGLWFGSAVFFSFVVGLTLFRTLDSRLAGVAISPMFAPYFLIQGVCGLLAAATAMGWTRLEPQLRVHRVRVVIILAALVTVLLGWPLEQKVSHLRKIRNEAVDALLIRSPVPSQDMQRVQQAADEARADFGRWHGYSLLLNFVTVLLVTVAMMLTACLPEGGTLHQVLSGGRKPPECEPAQGAYAPRSDTQEHGIDTPRSPSLGM